VRHQQSARGAESRQYQAFSEELFHQPAAPCAYGNPNHHFMASRERPDQQQITYVRASDQQNK
jgi:hypothetical protein